jgi:hypothetical protein
MPRGKAAGERCVQLSAEDNRCLIFGHPDRPSVCASLQPSPEMCGESREQALRWLGQLEAATQPPVQAHSPEATGSLQSVA